MARKYLSHFLFSCICNLFIIQPPTFRIFVSMDESDCDSDDKKKKSESLELTDVTKEVVSILKDRKKVVDGEDKTKTLDQKKLRDKVLDVKDSDRGEAKDLFEEALKKLEKKDEIKVNGDGDVK